MKNTPPTARKRRTHTLTLQLPPEFLERCDRDGVTPEEVLRGFIADLSEIISWQASPRKDGYNSHGSDERQMANDYYERVGYPYWNE